MADRKDKEPPSEKRKVTTDLALEYGTPDSPGYHTLASLMGRDGEYAIFRKFSSLNMLNLMTLQAELLELENRYKEALYMDERNEKGIPLATSFMALRKSNSRQKEVLGEIRKKLDEYSRWQHPMMVCSSDMFTRYGIVEVLSSFRTHQTPESRSEIHHALAKRRE
jgi:hypothetical protein